MDTQHGGMPPKKQMTEFSVKRKVVRSSGSQQVSGIPRFVKGGNNLWVYVNGKKEYCDYDYDEISNDTIKFKKPIPNGAMIEFLIVSP